ncbi:MAG: ChbG/HpnK family deacetylase [Acidobacteria bacterium]|nr:ChbG/HpnK family deacetylase [Acidobacteriota bacterium]MBI3656432.1 ChbG/HpnK family deacetylase [Acidobacteriota bacterium]
MKRLIVNADDFGLTRGISDGIIEGHRSGLITSATVMVNMAAFDYAVEGAQGCPNLGLGIHINLIDGRPVSTQPLPGLVNGEGKFLGSVRRLLQALLFKQVSLKTIELEVRAQIEKALRSIKEVTHIDGHKHIHVAPGIFPMILRLAREYRIRAARLPAEDRLAPGRRPAGVPWTQWIPQRMNSRAISLACLFMKRQLTYNNVITPDHFFGVTHTGFLDRAFLEWMLHALPDGVSELMCHPGYAGEDLKEVRTRLREQRESELRALTDPLAVALARALNVQLINYRDFIGSRVRA